MSEENKAIVRRFWQAFEANDLAMLNTVLAPELQAQPASAPAPQNREQHLKGVEMFNAAFSDRNFTVDVMIAEGGVVATRTTMRGVHTGEWEGKAPTGKPISATGLTLERVENGKIVERWFSFDSAQVMQQLGLALPA